MQSSSNLWSLSINGDPRYCFSSLPYAVFFCLGLIRRDVLRFTGCSEYDSYTFVDGCRSELRKTRQVFAFGRDYRISSITFEA